MRVLRKRPSPIPTIQRPPMNMARFDAPASRDAPIEKTSPPIDMARVRPRVSER